MNLLLHFTGDRLSEGGKVRLARFVAAASTPLLGGDHPIRQDQLWPQAKQWNDAPHRWRVRDPDEKGLPADERPSPPPSCPRC